MAGNLEQALKGCLLVQIGAQKYSLPVSGVERVVTLNAEELSTIPFDTSGRIIGIFNYKGAVTVLTNCKGLETYASQRGSSTLTAVILQYDGKHFAIPVDEATAVAHEAAADRFPPLSIRSLYFGGADEAD